MRKRIKYDFPNPVLFNHGNDYKNTCSFSSRCDRQKIRVNEENIIIPIEYDLKCKGLEDLVKNGDAVVVVSVKSGATSYNELFKFDKNEREREIKVPKFHVKNKIDIACSIVAAHNISKFYCKGEFNERYFGKTTFEIRKGDILATEPEDSIEFKDSRLGGPVSSIFRIARLNSSDSDDIGANFEISQDGKIAIYLKGEAYDLYYKLTECHNRAFVRLITSIVVYPVLVEAIEKLRGNLDRPGENSFNDKMWVRVIKAKAEEAGVDLNSRQKSSLTVASRFFNGIVMDALKDINNNIERLYHNRESDEEEE